ncbi:zinc finger protein ZAT9-like [Syzygium oleosum]|uniref:zinc finger protein ZAT9-like n=1 Tax=Syzygium oleosum TaxID=219896 RepID=UPI0024BBC041|nr:zinc finger protein ZAT9-like [Syzygium oleosum]XP_056175391.1 zinc finger protein ZAT9-like [Syzygium oleosum]
MEEDQELQHVCKICSKNFLCGRSLGGHMRSHLIDNELVETDENLNLNTSKLLSMNTGYGLRENPKKTWKGADFCEETSVSVSVQERFCRECGKGFQSWKALFGHMKRHSEKEKVSGSLGGQDGYDQKQLSRDGQSKGKEATILNRRRRSERRKRLVASAAATNSSSLSFATASSSASEIDQQEQEEVAMCLIMLSRDVKISSSLWGCEKEAKMKMKDLEEKNNLETRTSEFDDSQVDSRIADFFCDLANSGHWDKMNLLADSKQFKKEVPSQSEFSKIISGKNRIEEAVADHAGHQLGKTDSSKRKLISSYDPELKVNLLKKWDADISNSEILHSPVKRSRFQCTSCNKTFHSYQALGGHRASHKKAMPSLASEIESNDNSIETTISPDQTVDMKPLKLRKPESTSNLDKAVVFRNDLKIKSKEHECPICFKVFLSGQALGGHKRSHLLREPRTRKEEPISSIRNPIPKIREFLDLNLPAPLDEEERGHVDFTPWWLERNCNPEALIGLVSN